MAANNRLSEDSVDEVVSTKTPPKVAESLERLGRMAHIGSLSESSTSSSGSVCAEVPAEKDITVVSDYIAKIHKRLDALLKPLDFKYVQGRKLVIFKLGSDSKGWIPGPQHFDHVRRVLKASEMDKQMNILLMHYAISTETILME